MVLSAGIATIAESSGGPPILWLSLVESVSLKKFGKQASSPKRCEPWNKTSEESSFNRHRLSIAPVADLPFFLISIFVRVFLGFFWSNG